MKNTLTFLTLLVVASANLGHAERNEDVAAYQVVDTKTPAPPTRKRDLSAPRVRRTAPMESTGGGGSESSGYSTPSSEPRQGCPGMTNSTRGTAGGEGSMNGTTTRGNASATGTGSFRGNSTGPAISSDAAEQMEICGISLLVAAGFAMVLL